jgi:hypothetical protein
MRSQDFDRLTRSMLPREGRRNALKRVFGALGGTLTALAAQRVMAQPQPECQIRCPTIPTDNTCVVSACAADGACEPRALAQGSPCLRVVLLANMSAEQKRGICGRTGVGMARCNSCEDHPFAICPADMTDQLERSNYPGGFKCVNLNTNNGHCGRCGRTCPCETAAGCLSCVDGQCVPDPQ